MTPHLLDVLLRGVLDATSALVASSMFVAAWVTWSRMDRSGTRVRERVRDRD